MSEKLNLSLTGYAKIERGEVDISVSRIEQIANIFNLSSVELFLYGEKPFYFHQHHINLSTSDKSKPKHSHSNSHQYLYVNTLNNNTSEEILKLQFQIEKQELVLQNKELIIQQKDQEIAYLKLLLSQSE